jgi:hypothetical protein
VMNNSNNSLSNFNILEELDLMVAELVVVNQDSYWRKAILLR